jgi:hypothetical protein
MPKGKKSQDPKDPQEPSRYQLAARIREALSSPLFPPDDYSVAAISQKLIKCEIVEPWLLSSNNLNRQLIQAGWTHNGKLTTSSRWTKPQPPPPPVPPSPRAPEEEHTKGPITACVREIREHQDRIERMLARICEQLSISTE